MIKISKKAQKYLKNLISKNNKYVSLRILINKPGTQYSECKLSYENCKNLKKTDIEIKYDSFSIYVDEKILPYLKDSKIDLFINDTEKQLMLMAPYSGQELNHHNPTTQNVKYEHLFQKLKNFIDYDINPMLMMHGGKVFLVEINTLGYAMIKFLGGCNGCLMSKNTFSENIEKKILSHFPDLNGVQDITNHSRGMHSFF
ncbi:NifU family protein [Buchnera aphidicola]|uniref:NifU family protein n=1 Tax=Buchnera aphidicola TaxID=9 RepID=UPI003463D516